MNQNDMIETKKLLNFITKLSGIELGEDKIYLLETRLLHILDDYKCKDYFELNELLTTNEDGLAEKVIDAITTNETKWFRDEHPWVHLKSVLLPHYIKKLRSGETDKIRIWSAAASTGQEAYSTAITINEYLKEMNIKDVNMSNFEILATDISATCLNKARSGKYSEDNMARGMRQNIQERYFAEQDSEYQLNKEIMDSVNFVKFNLADSFASFGKFDLVLVRYVMIYFSEEFLKKFIKKIADVLLDDGVLFIGASEMNQKLLEAFKIQDSDNYSFYAKL